MAITTQERIVALMFSDVKKYSSIRDDRLYAAFGEQLHEFRERNLPATEAVLSNTWGDGLFVVTNTAPIMLEIALKYLAFFETTNWQRIGFPFHLMPRIGLHLEQATLHVEDGTVVRVSGGEINTASRIEPVVEPGQIYCSESFYLHARTRSASNVQFVSLGNRSLAKEAGLMHLYSVTLDDSLRSSRKSPQSVRKMRLRKNHTQLDRDNYLSESFAMVSDRFRLLLQSLSDGDPDVEVRVISSDDRMLSAAIYVQGQKASGAKIWLGGSFDRGINFSYNEDPQDTSMNEMLTVEDDGHELGLRPMGMFVLSPEKKLLTPEQAACYLWDGATKHLTV